MKAFGLERGIYGSEAKHRSNKEYYKELLKETKQKQLEEAELIKKVKELEKQAGKLRVKGTLYSLFGNSELDKAEQRITELENEAEQQRHLTEKEKNEIRKEVIHLQDTIKGKDKTISEQQREIKVYEEERSFIKRFFHSFYLLLNIRLMLRKMGFDDDTVVKMHQTRWQYMVLPMYILECTNATSRRRMWSYASPSARNVSQFLPSTDYPFQIGANKSGNNSFIVTACNDYNRFFLPLTKRKTGKNAHFCLQRVIFASEIVSVLWLFKMLYINALRFFLKSKL